MSFLTPLYIAGLLAVSLPILFHLIRRTPKGQVPFSSLMFLSPSPPRVTRRSRLDQILLLVLRGLALSLLALAFARPFLRDAASLEISNKPSRRIVLLVDRSASMRRGDLWQQATAKVAQSLADVTPADQVALLSFANRVETLVSFDNWNETDPARRVALVKGALDGATVSWGATQLGDALLAAADLLADVSDAEDTSSDVARQIVLVSDLQQGSRLEALQAYAWPKGVTLDVRSVTPKSPGNAGLHLAGETDGVEPASDGTLRVRVSNEADSPVEQFTLQWAAPSSGRMIGEPMKVYVPAGTSRVVRVKRPADPEDVIRRTDLPGGETAVTPHPDARQARRLVLRGDDQEFDNTLYVADPRKEEVTVAYFGADAADDAKGLRYYLDRAFVDTLRRKTRIVAVADDKPLAPGDVEAMRLAIVSGIVPEARMELLENYVSQGGTLLAALSGTEPALLARLLSFPALTIEEATDKDYALLGELAYTHPVFSPFADPRFSDFTKIHFWKHRRVTLPAEVKVNVLARFDNGDLAVFEHAVGKGSVIVFTSTWRPVDSQLAMSSKFVPLLSGLLDLHGGAESEQTQFTIGDRVPWGSVDPEKAQSPGVHDVGSKGSFAVNLAADESRTAPLGLEELEQRGVKLSSEEIRQADAQRRRQLRVAELENRQKLWRWLIVAVLGLIIAETALAGRLAKRTMNTAE